MCVCVCVYTNKYAIRKEKNKMVYLYFNRHVSLNKSSLPSYISDKYVYRVEEEKKGLLAFTFFFLLSIFFSLLFYLQTSHCVAILSLFFSPVTVELRHVSWQFSMHCVVLMCVSCKSNMKNNTSQKKYFCINR